MKKFFVFLLLIILSFYLSGCKIVSPDEAMFEKYCDQFPGDEGCLDDGNPTGIIAIDSESCLEGYILQDNVCVILNDNPIDIVNCDSGYHKEEGQCVLDQVDMVCEEDLILYNGNCTETCDVPIEDANYFPCFRECNDEFPCTHHKLVLAEGNSYFESFVMWIQKTDMNSSTEFVLHYILKGETDIIVSDGGANLWCTPSTVGCEELYKASYFISNTTGELDYVFSFWYDESWYTKVNQVSYRVWNSETNDYDSINLNLSFFYLEDVYNAD